MDKKITIYKAGTNEERIKVHIGKGSTAKFSLGKEDYVTIKFSLDSIVSFAYGDYIDINEISEERKGLADSLAMELNAIGNDYAFDERIRSLLSPRYMIVGATHPSYNTNTGGYDYTLRMEAWYMEWEHIIFRMPYVKRDYNESISTLNLNPGNAVSIRIETFEIKNGDVVTFRINDSEGAIVQDNYSLGVNGAWYAGIPINKDKTIIFNKDVEYMSLYISGDVITKKSTAYLVITKGSGDAEIYLNECEWSLTDKIENHVKALLYCLRSHGVNINARIDFNEVETASERTQNYALVEWSSSGGDYVISHVNNVDNITNGETRTDVFIEDDTKFIQYNKTKMISAIKSLSKEWDCDWWLEGDVLHFGRIESRNVADIKIGVSASSISSSNSSKDFATRLYVYGGTRNMSPTYRKKLVFSSTNQGNEITDQSKPINVNWFSTRRKNGRSWMSKSTYYADNTDGYMWGKYGLYFGTGSDYNLIYGSLNTGRVELGTCKQNWQIQSLYVLEGEDVMIDIDLNAIKGKISSTDTPTRFVESLKLSIVNSNGDTVLVENLSTDNSIADYYNPANGIYGRQFEHIRKIYTAESSGSIRIDVSSTGNFLLSYKLVASVTNEFNTALAKVVYEDGTSEDIEINPSGYAYYEANAKRVVSREYHPQGTKYTMEGLSWRKVPSNYYEGEFDNSSVLNKVSDIRLRMPAKDYVDIPIGRELTDDEIIEDVVILDDVYPHRGDTVSECKTYTYQETMIDAVTGEERKEDWNAYIIKGELLSRDFSNDYVLEGEDLMINFKTGKLAGMTFVVEYNKAHAFEPSQPEKMPDGTRNPEAQWFEIIKNEDYGIRLPNDVLRPEPGDTFVLFGYDTSFMANTLINDAEEELLRRATLEAQKQIHNQSTYDITILPSWLDGNDRWFRVGDSMRFDTGNYFVPVRSERIIGYEVKMDIPIDHPKFVVGESPAYSRLTSIESKIKS